MTDLPASIVLDGSDIFVEFKGAMAEQYAMQQLKSDTDLHPFFFRKTQYNEIDFVVQSDRDIVPVEIKAGNNLRSRSLLAYCKEYEPRKAIRCSLHKYHEDDPITELPLYAMANVEKVIK